MGADVADLVGVYNFSAFRDLRLVDEKDGFGAGDALAFRAGFFYSDGKKYTTFVRVVAGTNFSSWTFKKSVK